MSETTVAIYVRVSTVEQAEKGWSLDGQTKECREFCEAQGHRVVRLYKDKGFSATTLERPMLQKMLEHASMGMFDRIVLWKYDRLSRNNMDFPALLHFFSKQGIEVCSVREPTPNDGSPYNEFIIGILGLVSSL
ncbi:MAG: recombinase family protein, partial [Thermoplasmata archaeon]|nr:recombinase family protein [Thermoplasmata archaeon]